MKDIGTLLIGELLAGYRERRFTPVDVLEAVLDRIESAPEHHVWIQRLSREQVLDQARALQDRSPELPLYGIPFAIKDNIDLAGVPTTAGCPAYAYQPRESSTVVQKLIDAGALPVGKTNLDQFATGLVGVRSPYGAGRNSFDPRYIAGGSSSGSAVAVAMGLVSFSLGTDTAGSGRVPAAFNNLIGLKPTCGRLSTRGVVPACRSLDCVSIFALTAADAAAVLDVAQGFDADDPYSRKEALGQSPVPLTQSPFRFGVPLANQLEFFGDGEYAQLFKEAAGKLEEMGGQRVEIDCAPFFETARLLYDGPWRAERYAVVERLLKEEPGSVLPVTREIIGAGARITAVATFRAQYRLRELKRMADSVWDKVDVLLMPTAGTVYRIDEVLADPIRLNANLGYYTNYLNLLDLAAVAVPGGFRSDGLPFGVTLVGQAWTDRTLLALGSRFHQIQDLPLGALKARRSSTQERVQDFAADAIPVAVCGAHMEGLPLNPQLTERGAVLVKRTRTAEHYRLYALPGGPPHRPGLVRVAAQGAAIEVEVWAVPASRFGSFVTGVPSPLVIGKVLLEDGQVVSGFLCEAIGVDGAADITALGSWRRYLAQPPGA